MEEIEIKILEIDKDKVIKKLLSLGAKKEFEGNMFSISLDLNNKLHKNRDTLRIRKKGSKNILTLKLKKSDKEAKITDEYEVEVENFDKTLLIFEKLGFRKVKKDLRYRTSYKLKNSLVEIDEYKHIPSFLEVESPSIEELKEIVKLLGFSMNQTKTWSRGKVIEHYKSKKHS